MCFLKPWGFQDHPQVMYGVGPDPHPFLNGRTPNGLSFILTILTKWDDPPFVPIDPSNLRRSIMVFFLEKKSPSLRITGKYHSKPPSPPAVPPKTPRWRNSDSRPQRTGTSGTFTGHAGRWSSTAPGVRGGAMPSCAGAGGTWGEVFFSVKTLGYPLGGWAPRVWTDTW